MKIIIVSICIVIFFLAFFAINQNSLQQTRSARVLPSKTTSSVSTSNQEFGNSASATNIPVQTNLGEIYLKRNYSANLLLRLLDEFGAPVVGVRVHGISHAIGTNDIISEELTSVTDSHGYAMYRLIADTFNLAYVEKSGFDTNFAPAETIIISRHLKSTNAANAIPIYIWKERPGEPLLKTSIFTLFSDTQRTNYLNLVTGKMYKTPPDKYDIILINKPIVDNKDYLYEFSIKVNDGGISPVNLPFILEAPVNGYTKSLTVTYNARRAEFSEGKVAGRACLRLRSGKIFASINYYVRCESVKIESLVNYQGGLNLYPAKGYFEVDKESIDRQL